MTSELGSNSSVCLTLVNEARNLWMSTLTNFGMGKTEELALGLVRSGGIFLKQWRGAEICKVLKI